MSRKKHRKKQPLVASEASDARPDRENRCSPWKFRVAAALLAPIVLLMLLEGALRLAGCGYPTAFFLRGKVDGRPVFYDNQKFGWRFFTPAAARTPRRVTLAAEKKAIRIFVFGESAAMGDPDAAFGMPRILEVLLRNRFPGLEFEVVNAAMTAINSHAVLRIAGDCAPRQGDVWILYMGNNEAVGPFGPGTVFGTQAPGLAWIRTILAVKSTRVGQVLDELQMRLFHPKALSQSWGGMELFADRQLALEDPRMARLYSHFESNLDAILALGSGAGARIVMGTVASNIKDCPPFASLHRPDLTDVQRTEWDGWFRQGVDAGKAGDWPKALACFERGAQIDDRPAELAYHSGRCLLAMGDVDKARRQFERARDLDALRFRCDTQLNNIIRRSASKGANRQVGFVDCEQLLAAQNGQGIAGDDLFYEHVHLRFSGNYRLAALFADKVASALPQCAKPESRPQPDWASMDDCARQLAFTAWNRYESLEIMLRRMERSPFTLQWNHAERYAALQAESRTLRDGLTPAAIADCASQFRAPMEKKSSDWILHEKLAQLLKQKNDIAGAAEQWSQVARLLPHNPEALYQWGTLLDQLGQSDEGIVRFRTALALKHRFPDAWNGLGRALAGKGDHRAAILCYGKALGMNPSDAKAHLNLGLSLEALGNTAEARRHFNDALQLKPELSAASQSLGRLLNQQGDVAGAAAQYTEALAKNPGDAFAHFKLGNALRAMGKTSEARGHFAEAVRLSPEFAEARCKLGFELARSGRDAEAAVQFNEALRLNPSLGEAHLNLGVALAKMQRHQEAVSHFQEAVRLDPTDDTAKKYMDAARTLIRKQN